jgi:tetrahydromethanopterin S-methyltransferase subunit A
MKYLKLYESFIEQVDLEEVDLEDRELSDMTIDDFINYDSGSYIDSSGVIHIKNWKVY